MSTEEDSLKELFARIQKWHGQWVVVENVEGRSAKLDEETAIMVFSSYYSDSTASLALSHAKGILKYSNRCGVAMVQCDFPIELLQRAFGR